MKIEATTKPKHVRTMKRRNGTIVCYYRRPGCVAVPLPLPIGSPEFNQAYKEAEAQTVFLVKRRRTSGLHPASAGRLAGAIKDTMADCGVYLLLRAGRVVYVGTSKNCGARIADHRASGRDFDRAYYIFAEDGDRDRLEAILIRQLAPEGNKRNRAPHSLKPSVARA
jgi:hypothetical protein